MAGEVYQLHVLLAGVEPTIWRRLLVSGNTSLAELHRIVQVVFAWGDARRHHFDIRGKQYGGAETAALPETVTLARIGFRAKERFLYQYGFSDEWRHQIRFEGTPALSASLALAVCIGGARAGPSDECTAPRDYARQLSVRLGDVPWVEGLYVGHALARLAHAQPDETVREAIGDVEAFAQAVQRLRTHDRLNSNRFDRHEVNRRLRALAEGDEHGRESDDDNDSSDN